MIIGTAGTIEVRSMENTITVVDGERIEVIDCTDEPLHWAEAFLAGEMPVPQTHVIAVHDICLRAQQVAARQPN
jgi:hypothetical protein